MMTLVLFIEITYDTRVRFIAVIWNIDVMALHKPIGIKDLRLFGIWFLFPPDFINMIGNMGKVAVVVVKEKRKKASYLVSTNLHLSALDIVKYYAKRWKIEQMIKDLKQRLGFGHYQVRNPQAIQRHVALVLLSYGILILLKILQWLRDKTVPLDVSIRLLAFQVRRHILLKHIAVALNRMKVEFKQGFLYIYLENLLA
ncbi:MAG: transposase [Thermodesulfobacteriota bacterium]